MNKKLVATAVAYVALAFLGGCNSGSTNNPTISVAVIGTPSTCTGMINGSQCTVQITYNTNSTSNISLGTTPVQSSLPTSITSNPSFINSLTTCQNQVGTSSGQTTCSMTITYTSNGGTNINLGFTLGGTTSNTIPVIGN